VKQFHLIVWTVVLALCAPLSAQANGASNPALDKVLKQMDATAGSFRTAQADFVWDQYQAVVKESDTQKGKVYFRRAGKNTQMMAHITAPAEKFVLYSEGKVQVYEPKIDQVTTYNAGKNSADVESFLVLGFGGGGHEMLKSFDVKYDGTEQVDGVDASKLDLTPKSQRVRGMFEHIMMWVDPARGVSVQQQVFQSGGDYRLAKYSNIQLNQRLSDNDFKLHTTGNTKFVSPNGL
jgi:outer membrane lipoprotein-sorting protein